MCAREENAKKRRLEEEKKLEEFKKEEVTSIIQKEMAEEVFKHAKKIYHDAKRWAENTTTHMIRTQDAVEGQKFAVKNTCKLAQRYSQKHIRIEGRSNSVRTNRNEENVFSENEEKIEDGAVARGTSETNKKKKSNLKKTVKTRPKRIARKVAQTPMKKAKVSAESRSMRRTKKKTTKWNGEEQSSKKTTVIRSLRRKSIAPPVPLP